MTERASRPTLGEFAPDFERYIKLVPAGDVVAVLAEQLKRTQAIFEPLSEAQSLTVHPPYTWTLKQVLGHVTDGEASSATAPCDWPVKTPRRSRASTKTASWRPPISTIGRWPNCWRSSSAFAVRTSYS